MSVRFLTRRKQQKIVDLIADKNDTIYGQALMLRAVEAENVELKRILIASYRATRDFAASMRIANEEEIDVSEDLATMVVELSDQISLLEEHHVVL